MRLPLLLTLFVFSISHQNFAQVNDTMVVVKDSVCINDSIIAVKDTVRVKIPEKDSRWTKKNTVGFDLNQIAFVNWSAGGVSSVSGLLKAAFIRRYETQNIKWGNELIMRYGMNKQDGIEFRKTDDVFQLSSTLG